MRDEKAGRDAERFRRVLASAAPAAPDPHARAATVQTRAREQRKTTGALGAIALVAAVAAVAITPSLVRHGPVGGGANGPSDASRISVTSPLPPPDEQPATPMPPLGKHANPH